MTFYRQNDQMMYPTLDHYITILEKLECKYLSKNLPSKITITSSSWYTIENSYFLRETILKNILIFYVTA